MTKIRLTLLFVICTLVCFCQGKITGNVFLQSSNWTPVEGINVNAEDSNGDYSKADGYFELIFPNLSVGDVVSPYIGKNNVAIDKRGKVFELVNERELEFLALAKNPKQNQLKIIVCKT